MKKKLIRWIPILFSLLLLAGGVTLRIADPALIQTLRLGVYDSFQRLKPRVYEPAPVRIIDLDDETLARMGQWPWPRTLVAELVERLTSLGAAVIVFDIVFAEPDRTSPRAVLPLWPDIPEVEALRQAAAKLPSHDEILAQAIAKSRVVTGFVLDRSGAGRTPVLKKSYVFGGEDPLRWATRFTGAVTSLAVLEDAAAGNGSFNMTIDQDGIVRRYNTMVRLGDALYPSLALETLRVVQGGRRSFQIKTAGASGEYAMGASTGITKVKIGSFVIPTDSRGRMWIHFTDSVSERFIPAWKVFEADFPRQAVEGMILLIGTSAAGLKDQRPTPLNPAAAGVEVHAQALEQIILGKFLERPDWAEGAEILYLAGLGMTLILLLPWLGALWCAVLGGGATLGAFGFSWYAYDTLGMLFDPVYPSIFALMVYIILSLVNFLRNEAEKNQVRGAFGRYMSPALVEQLAENPDQLQLGGVMRDMTILFADVRGFTAISEIYKSDPQGLTSLINRFLTPTTDVILARQGTIDKYMGDCIMAFWNAPLDDDDHARHACSSAMQMMIVVDELNVVLEAEAKAEDRRFIPIIIGIGLNSGECCVGNMGSEQRFDYSVLGDDVNLAARLEGQSKTYGVDIVIGENTYSRAPDYAYIELDLIKVKGKNEAVRIHALLGKPEICETADFIQLAERHAAMLTAYRAQNWDEARSLGTECRSLGEKFGGLGRLYDLYDGRIDEFLADPPGADWDGVFVATTK
jgi:adenylate cyclase